MEELARNDVMTPEEVAEYLKISVRKVHALCRDGRLEYVAIGPRIRRFLVESVREFTMKNAKRTPLQCAQSHVDIRIPGRVTSPRAKKLGGEKSSREKARALTREIRSW